MNNDYKYEQVWRHVSHGQLPSAIELLKELLANEPNSAMYHGTLAYCLLQQMRIHAAEYELKIALQLEPNEPFLHSIYARIYFLQNKVRQALAACDQALQLDPENADVFELKSDILLANKKFKEGFFYLQKMAALNPDSIKTVYSFAMYYFHIGDNAKAMEFTLAALAMDAQHQETNVLMGRLQLIQGNIAEAEYHARLSIMLNPSSREALALFADVKARKNIFLGLWWKFNAKVSRMKPLHQVGVLIFGYVFFSLLSNIVYDLGFVKSSDVIDYAWLAIVIYSWVAIPIYQRMLTKELEQFSFRPNY
jgi:predicted Zn-dependent protease